MTETSAHQAIDRLILNDGLSWFLSGLWMENVLRSIVFFI